MTELKEIYNRITSFEARMTMVECDSKKTLQIVTELKMAIIGSDQLKVDGMAQKVEKHEKYIENNKKQKWMIAGGITVLMALWSILIAFKEKIFG